MSLRPLRSAVDAWTPGRGIAAEPLHRIAAAWSDIVGRNVAAHCEPVELNSTTLLVATRSSAWSQQLHMLSPAILAALNAIPEGAAVRRLAFRVGALHRAERRSAGRRRPGASERRPASSPSGVGSNGPPPEPAIDAAAALARLRARVQRLRRVAGRSCAACGAALEASAAERCAPCDGEADRERLLAIQRFVYMAPWLGLAEVREQIPDLSGAEFERARRLLLQRWWLMLDRARRAGKLSPSGIERHVASSYVLLQSRLPPERITPAVVANLLGDETAKLLWPAPSPGRPGSVVE